MDFADMAKKKPPGRYVVDIDLGQTRAVRHAEFVRHYLEMHPKDHVKAAKMAGYKNPALEGIRLMKNPWVVNQIIEQMDKANKKSEVDIVFVRVKLVELLAGCMQKIPVLDDSGEDSGLYKFMDATVARGCIKDLGEMVDVQAFVKNFGGTINHQHTHQPAIDVSKLSIDEQKTMLEMILKAKTTVTAEEAPKRLVSNVIETTQDSSGAFVPSEGESDTDE